MGKRKELPPELGFLTANDTDKFIMEKIILKRSFDYRKVHLEAGTEMSAVKYVKIDEEKNYDLKKLSCPEWFTLCKMFKIPNASRMRIEHIRVCLASVISGNHDHERADGSSIKQAPRRQLPLHQQERAASAPDDSTIDDDSTPNPDHRAGNGKTSASSASTNEPTSAMFSHGKQSKEAVALAISKAAFLASSASSKLTESTLAMLSVGSKPPSDIVARLAQAETDLVNATAAVAAARARAIATTHLMAVENESNDGRPNKKPRHST